jgi:ATP-dependent 26S proteasome regulatory subunit
MIVLIIGLSNFLYAGSKKSTKKKTSDSKCKTDKRNCEKKNAGYKRQISQLNNAKSSLTRSNNTLKQDNNKLKANVGKLNTENNQLKKDIKNLNELTNNKNEKSVDSLLYCKCHSTDLEGKKSNCNLSKHWLCQSTKKIDNNAFVGLKEKSVAECIMKNTETYIGQYGYWLKSKLEKEFHMDVRNWDKCHQNNSFRDVLGSNGDVDSQCKTLREKLKEFLVSDHYNAFHGNKLCIKGIYQGELM